VWDHHTGDWNKGWRYSAGPFIADGKIIQGMTGCGNAQPGGCFVTAHDPETGDELWRVYTIARPDTEEGKTWNGLPLESRMGGSAWIAGSYDPEQNLIFYGVGQPYPWIAEMNGLLPPSGEPGVTNDALYTDSTLAIDAPTGELKWYHQYLKMDTWDLDYAYERMLIDLPFDGQEKKQLVTVGKLGIIESIDRTNGDWLWAKETISARRR
jgi:alcohol dehydrogenase (cytochrome c)